MSELTDRGVAFRAAIAGFIDARREAKLKGNEGDAAAAAAAKYSYDAWLADAVRRVSQIQAVTHFFDELSLHHDRLPDAVPAIDEEDDAQEARAASCAAN